MRPIEGHAVTKKAHGEKLEKKERANLKHERLKKSGLTYELHHGAVVRCRQTEKGISGTHRGAKGSHKALH